MSRLIKITGQSDIPEEYSDNPIGLLLEYHNLKRQHIYYHKPQMLICTCMDSRVNIRIPENFAFVIRAGGADMSGQEFKMAFAVSSAGLQHIAIIGHSDCGMVNLESKKETFINGMVFYAGWEEDEADEYFREHSGRFEIHNEINFLLTHANEMRELFPKVTVVPMLYRVEDNRIYLINEN